jgi:hypothetical protein
MRPKRPEDIQALKTVAEEKGIGHTTLVRMWVKERIRVHQDRRSADSIHG